jgi:hypothetical protein
MTCDSLPIIIVSTNIREYGIRNSKPSPIIIGYRIYNSKALPIFIGSDKIIDNIGNSEYSQQP